MEGAGPPVTSARRAFDVAFDRRLTSHMSAGMSLYVRRLVELLPLVAPDVRFAFCGSGDNFDIAEQFGLPLTLRRLHPRLVHFPTPFVPLAVPLPYVLTIHDLIDLHYPQFGKRKVGPYYRYVVGPAARRARAVITDDPRTVGDLERFLGVDVRRIRVISLGVDLPQPAGTVRRERPFVLYVGNTRPHKNLATLVAAWQQLPAALDVDLLLTGTEPPAWELAGAARSNGRIQFVGALTDAELVALYRAAAVYVHPALREGFGLPMLEAIRAGTPVIAARSAVPQALAGHVQTFEPTNAVELRDAISRVLAEPQRFAVVAAAAGEATRLLTWERTARLTADVYREALR